jgi:CHAD domain-containing protein
MEEHIVVKPQAVAEEPASSAPVESAPGFHHVVKRVRELAAKQLNRCMSYEPKVLKGEDPDAIHDMRVASRRLQQTLDLLYPKPRSQELRQLRRKIRRCRQALGEVRNCDVLLDHVRHALSRKRSARREAWTAVEQFLVTRRLESFHRALHKFGKINPTGCYVDLKALLHHDKTHHLAAEQHTNNGHAASASFTQDLGEALDSTWRRFAEQIEQSQHDFSPEVVHGARIATKRLRYLIEVMHELDVPGSDEALGWLRHVQKHLGDWHDLEVLEEMMIEMLARPEFLRDHLRLSLEVGKLILRNRELKHEFQKQYTSMSLDSVEMLRLKEWVAYRVVSPSATSTKG